ncbi:MAG TPA: class I SAM-dependent methyltransferase [Terrimesophilobacter sp.]|nr:class I SAM-dependent methyltransferase [Terrimesophilobacter sp.]
MTTREKYTHGHHESVLRTHGWRTAENSAPHLLPHLAPGLSLLDVGSGPGTMTVDFAQRVAPARVVGVDASADVVEKAAAHASDRGVSNIEFIVGDAYHLPFSDGEFDVVHTHQTLQHVSDPVAVLREMRRVRANDGLVAAREVDYPAVFWHPESPGLEKWYATYDAVHRGNGGEPAAGRHLKSWALDAGFTEVLAGASVWHFSTDAEREWWGGAWADRALHSEFAKGAIEQGHATSDDLADVSAAWREWAANPRSSLFMPHGEILARG